jgi:gas vesicle protein
MLGGPAGGFAGAVAGHEIADIVGEKTGKGMKIVNRRSYKGTPEMKERMKRLRELRKKQRMAVEGEISDKMLDRQATTLHHRELDRLRGEKGRTANLFGELRTKNPIKEGQGLFRTLHKMGIHRKDVVHAGKVMGKAAAEHGIDTMANIAGAYGFPVPPAITESLKQSTDHLIDGNHKRAMESIKAPAKEIMKEQIQKQVDKLPIEVQPFVESKVVSMGLGLKKKHQRVVKGGTVRITRRPKILYKNLFSGSGLSDDTFSSIASIHAPQMHPYVPQINSFVRAVPLNGHGLYQPSGHGLF